MGICSSNCDNCSHMLKSNIDISNLAKDSTFSISIYSREINRIVYLQVRLKLFLRKIHKKKLRASSSLFKIKKLSLGGSTGSIGDISKHSREVIEDDASYIGQMKNGVREGIGILKWDCFKYIGQFNDNKPNGFGKLIDNNDNIYQGFFHNFIIEGFGQFKSPSSVYKGEWSEHKQEGFGIEKWNKTSIYRGEYKKGLKHGIGVLCFRGLNGYEGEFKNGEMSGRGTFFFSDKRKYQGQWNSNKMNGCGIITWPDGKTFEGKFVNDNKEGLGILYALSKVYIGNWSNNNLIGKVIIINNGKITKQLWLNGKPVRELEDNEITPYDKYITSDLIKYSIRVSSRTTNSTNSNAIESNKHIHQHYH